MNSEALCNAATRDAPPQSVAERFSHLYPELLSLARAKMRGERDLTLIDTTVLVHESYLKLLAQAHIAQAERGTFMAYAAQVMRGVLVDYARARRTQRRGAGAVHVPMDTDLCDSVAAPEDQVLELHDALDMLAQAEPRLAQVVEMRYFAGMTEAEIATALGVSDRTVRRDWDKAKLLLQVALR